MRPGAAHWRYLAPSGSPPIDEPLHESIRCASSTCSPRNCHDGNCRKRNHGRTRAAGDGKYGGDLRSDCYRLVNRPAGDEDLAMASGSAARRSAPQGGQPRRFAPLLMTRVGRRGGEGRVDHPLASPRRNRQSRRFSAHDVRACLVDTLAARVLFISSTWYASGPWRREDGARGA